MVKLLNQLMCSALLICLIGFGVNAQTNLDDFMERSAKANEQTVTDISDYVVTSTHTSKRSGITHYYLQQQHEGIPIYNSVSSIHLNDQGDLVKMDNQFFRNIDTKVNTKVPTLNPTAILKKVADKLQYDISDLPSMVEETNRSAVFTGGSFANNDIPIKLVYQPMEDGSLRLCWDLSIDEKEDADYLSIRVDAITGEILDKVNWTLYCDFGDAECAGEEHTHGHQCYAHEQMRESEEQQESAAMVAPDSYRVFQEPVESPLHGGRTLVVNPADPIASPYGWHDTNGAAGAEYTTTRGNNVYAREDANGNDGNGFSPDGTASLDFDFALDLSQSPNADPSRSAGITNLFYWNNLVHDVWYQYGFDEVSGNFQTNNYGRGGTAGDEVLADAQDGGGTNNANFSTPGDGGNGYMQMYLWTGASAGTLDVNSPASIAGGYASTAAQFGQGTFSVTGNLVEVDDGTAAPTEGCNALVNGGAVNGNIAIVDRGNCEFGLKCLNAQNAGAIAVIVCNNVAGAPIAMGPGADGAAVTIPAVMISQADCQTIRVQIPTVNVTLVSGASNDRDGDFDNGIVAHEYGHGISIRLTGGRNNSGCLNNSEQMGEGWSDWFGLMMTINPTDTRNDVRPVGTFALGQSTTGSGIRTYPYTCDLAINPHTYNDIANEAVPHGVGSVWCAMLWEMTWDLIDTYGYDPDIHYGTGGNNIAMALVIEGLKLQPCSPGFVDGRDAILAADQALYNGANNCLIRAAFARRGLGDSASQGASGSNTDGQENFVSNCGPPTCDDGILNQDEVGVDCGGETCPVCPPDVCNDFDFNGIISYDAADNDNGTATVSNGGSDVLITGNGWKAIPINYTVTPSTVVTFEFRSTVQGEIHEVGFDNDLIFTPDHRIVVYGNQGYAGTFNNSTYTGSGNWETFTVSLGSVFTGAYQYMVLTADDDATGNGISEFRNLQIFEDNNGNLVCDAACAGVDLDITFDGWPDQTSWDIVDGTGAVVAASPDYSGVTGGSNLNLTSVTCLADGCYTFNMYDSYGNGMCPKTFNAYSQTVGYIPGGTITGSFGTIGISNTAGRCGNYKLYDTDGTLILSGGLNFGSSESQTFCIAGGVAQKVGNTEGSNLAVRDLLSVHPTLASNFLNLKFGFDNDTDVNLYVLDINGKVVIQQEGITVSNWANMQLDVANLNTGSYFVKMVSAEGTTTKRFVKN